MAAASHALGVDIAESPAVAPPLAGAEVTPKKQLSIKMQGRIAVKGSNLQGKPRIQ